MANQYKVYLSQLQKRYKVNFQHNPKHFYLNSLKIETSPNGQKLLVGTPRPHSKQFRILARLTPIEKNDARIESIKKVQHKSFFGLFQD